MNSIEIFAGGGGLAMPAFITIKEGLIMNVYTIIGYYVDTMQRFADTTTSANPEEAEQCILNKYKGIAVCGVIKGRHHCVDTHEIVQTAKISL